MQSKDIRVGEHYGYRDYPRLVRSPLIEVEALENVKSATWKIRHIGGAHPGLNDYVRSMNLVVPWAEAKDFLKDEDRLETLIERSKAQHAESGDKTIVEAVSNVFNSMGEEHFFNSWGGKEFGTLSILPSVARRLMIRTKLPSNPLELDDSGFVDRFGRLHLPFGAALRIAKAFVLAEPDTAQAWVDSEERHWEEENRRAGNPYLREAVHELKAGRQLIREWAAEGIKDQTQRASLNDVRLGVENSLEFLWLHLARLEKDRTEENSRLRSLVAKAADMLRIAGRSREAEELHRELEGKES